MLFIFGIFLIGAVSGGLAVYFYMFEIRKEDGMIDFIAEDGHMKWIFDLRYADRKYYMSQEFLIFKNKRFYK